MLFNKPNQASQPPPWARQIQNAGKSMKSNRPRSLTAVAWLFILTGVLAVGSTVLQAFGGALSLNIAVLGIPGGIGLLRARRGWRTFCLCSLWVFGVSSVFLVGTAIFAPQKIYFSGFGRPYPEFAMLVAVASISISVWAYSVLTQKEVRAIFGIDSDVPRSA